MALPMIENLLQQAKDISQEEIDRMCAGVLANLYVPDKSSEALNSLRRLFFILQASNTEPCLPLKFIATMINMVSSMDREKTKECLLCAQMMTELLPRDKDDLGQDFYGDSSHTNPKSVSNCFTMYMLQGNKQKCIAQLIPQAVQWMSSQAVDFEVQKQAFSFLIATSLLHTGLFQGDSSKQSSKTISDWLMKASMYQAQNPYTINPFRKDQNNMVGEVDGTPSRNFFTVLNIGQYYTDDQFLNIYSFSMLYKWLYHCYKASQLGQTQERTGSSVGSSPTGTAIQSVFDVLVGKTIDYCFRIMDQCERKPKVPSDQDLQSCCLHETIKILDLICTIDPGQVPKIFQEMRRLYSRLSQDNTKSRLLLPILQYFINHSKAVLHDPQEAYSLVFSKLLSYGFVDPALSFDVIMFIQDNLETICLDTNILSSYFPNILKILAWNPRTYLSEFEEILPAMISPTTAVEVLHSLLDLPCMTITLEVQEKLKSRGDNSVPPSQGDIEPTTTLEAYSNQYYRPMFNFFSRVDGGIGDTINRLGTFHGILIDMSHNPRVIVCSQTVPVLLRVWFEIVIEEGTPEFASRLLPVLLERSGLLFDIDDFKTDIKRIIAENIVKMFEKFPTVLIEQLTEILDFLMSISNIKGREEFYANLVWAVGEFCSSTHDKRCSLDIVRRAFDNLEPQAYEISALVSTTTVGAPVDHAKIISMFMSTLAKLASRCQDLIPRAILCFTKVAQQQQQGAVHNPEIQDPLVSRAQHLINLLKLPNFAAVVLNPSPEVHSGRWHTDSTAIPAVLRGVHRLVTSETET